MFQEQISDGILMKQLSVKPEGHGQDVIGTFFDQQDTLIGLRHQLDEVKAINVEMYQKMQVQIPDRLKIHTVCMSTVCETNAHSWPLF